MILLLDTHVLVWSQEFPERIGPKTKRSLLDPGNEICVSPFSTLELARLVSMGHVTFKIGLDAWLANSLVLLKARSLAFDHRIALAAYDLPGAFHKDPADRVLVATARVEGAILITADELILKYPHVHARDARK